MKWGRFKNNTYIKLTLVEWGNYCVYFARLPLSHAPFRKRRFIYVMFAPHETQYLIRAVKRLWGKSLGERIVQRMKEEASE